VRPTLAPPLEKRRIRGLSRETPTAGDDRGAGLLGAYLREVGRYRLLTADEEILHSRALRRARRDLARVARALPAEARFRTVGSRRVPAADRWTLDGIETWYQRLSALGGDDAPASLRRALHQARSHKAELDRARNALVLANLRLVAHIARKYLNQGVPLMDLIQEGNLGLLRAVEKFEPARGNRFSTYAYWWIKQAVARGIAGKARVVRLPVHVVETMQKIRRVAGDRARETGEAPDLHEIAGELDLPTDKIEAVMRAGGATLSLDDAAREGERPLMSRVADHASISPQIEAERREVERTVRRALASLTPREAQVIRLRFGFDSERAHTLEEIGSRIDLSRERVRQIERQAMQKIGSCDRTRELSRRLVDH